MAEKTQKTDKGQGVQAPAKTQANEELIKAVKQLILLSISLKFEEKGKLITRLPELSEEKLLKLKKVFEDENARKQELLTEFFTEHPELYADFERFSKEHVDTIYRDVEQGELGVEETKMEELLQVSF
jgi:hypothetical protein